MRIIMVAALLLLTFMSILPVSGEERQWKIGFIDLKRVYEESGRKEAYETKMEELEREKRIVMSEMRDKISTMERMMWELSEEKRKGKEEEIRLKTREYRDYEKQAQAELSRKSREFEREFAKELKAVVTQIAEEGEYTFIVSDITILYSDPEYDLTDKAISRLKSGSDEETGDAASKNK